MAVRANDALKGRVVQRTAAIDIAPVARPGELISVVIFSNGSSGLAMQAIAEKPKDFNALKASLAFYNFDPACNGAGLTLAGRDTVIFENGPLRAVQRRAVNPVALSVQPVCGTQRAGAVLDLGTLEAGQRYSVFMVGHAQKQRAFWVKDVVAF